jgi:hypothetical protein
MVAAKIIEKAGQGAGWAGVAVGACAAGAMAVGALAISRAKIGRLEIDTLAVRNLVLLDQRMPARASRRGSAMPGSVSALLPAIAGGVAIIGGALAWRHGATAPRREVESDMRDADERAIETTADEAFR